MRAHRAQRENTRQVIASLVGGFSPRPSECRCYQSMPEHQQELADALSRSR